MSHRRGISRSFIVAASAAALSIASACSDLGLSGNELLPTSALLILPLSSGAPAPGSTTFWVHNSRNTVRRISHADAYNTPYLEIEFPANSLSSLSGSMLTNSDSVLVTIDPRPGAYGFTLSPTGLGINANAAPEVTFFFGLYGDATVAGSTNTYTDPADYVAALDVWHEVTVGQWRVVAGSGTAGPDIVSGSVTEAGQYVLAAPR